MVGQLFSYFGQGKAMQNSVSHFKNTCFIRVFQTCDWADDAVASNVLLSKKNQNMMNISLKKEVNTRYERVFLGFRKWVQWIIYELKIRSFSLSIIREVKTYKIQISWTTCMLLFHIPCCKHENLQNPKTGRGSLVSSPGLPLSRL